MDYRNILNFVNTPGTIDVLQASPTSSETSLSSFGSTDPNNNAVKTSGKPVCGGCCINIRDRWILKVGSQAFHMACLRCSVCLRTLDNHASCFIRDNAVYCRFHYVREYGTKCTGCSDYLLPTDWVHRARDLVYHAACFRCYVCKRQLHSGETAVAMDDLVVCYEHKDANLCIDEVDSLSVSSMDSDSRSSDFDDRAAKRPRSVEPDSHREPSEKGAKRSRSNFNAEQLQVLQAAFTQKAMPTGEEVEMLAHGLGLTKKTVCIWFQNARARSKRSGIQTFRKSGGKGSRLTNPPIHTIVLD